MVLEILADFGTTGIFLLLIIFVLFLLVMKRVFSVVVNAVWIVIASAAFPFAMRHLLGFAVPTDLNTIISFIILGLSMYGLYLLGRLVYAVLGVVEKGGKVVAAPILHRRKKKKEKMQEKIEELVKEREERKKKEEKTKKKAKKRARKKKKKDPDEDYVELDSEQKSFVEPLEIIEPED